MKESEIRKKEVLDKYLKLVEEDVGTFFKSDEFVDVNCPACSERNYSFAFEKTGLRYVLCGTCRTLFVNPRPGIRALKEFYSNSPSTDFWINEYFKPVANARREKIFTPRAKYISGILDSKKIHTVGDIGAGFGIFLEEMRKICPQNRYVAIEPSLRMAELCRGKGLEVKCDCLEDIKGMEKSFDLMTCFELVEHLFDPAAFLKRVYSLLKPGGYLYITTLNGMGFDILLLWEKSKSIVPHHINFYNTASIKHLLEKAGFEIVEISTPGRLDWERVEGAMRDEGVDIGGFWDLLAREGTESSKNELQDWISRNNLSSHMRAVAKRPAQ